MGAYFMCGFIVILVVLCSSEAEVVTVDVHAAKNLLNQGHIYLDVRTEEEFKNGHLENALNIPYMINTPKGMVNNPNFLDQVLSICRNEYKLVLDQIYINHPLYLQLSKLKIIDLVMVLVYQGCKSGVRSLYAATDLVNAEFKHVYNMGGGYTAWIQNGFAVHKPHTQEL